MATPDVYIAKLTRSQYPDYPFHPAEIYPEFNSSESDRKTDETNQVYGAIREILRQLGLDQERFGTPQWNPLKNFVRKNQTVLLKPNFVKGDHPLGLSGVLSMITHASLMRPVIDYILLATDNHVKIIVGDVPLQSSDWHDIVEKTGTKKLVEFYQQQGVNIRLVDMRWEIAIFNEENIIERKVKRFTRQCSDYVVVDLGKDSALNDVSRYSDKLEITDYGYGTVSRHHNHRKNEYMIAREILKADCIINLPKMKTHRKAGITCAMKNLVGINGDKSWIAHHRRGLPKEGGDEFEEYHLKTVLRERIWNYLKTNEAGIKIATWLKKIFRTFVWKGKSYEEVSMHSESKHYREGSWHGNDTIWRCIRDLNQILFYADKKGEMQPEKQRHYLCLVDGIIAAEKEGPMEHLPKKTGIILGGLNPVEVDFAVAEIMGFDYQKIPSIARAFNLQKYPLTTKIPGSIKIAANCSADEYRFKFLTPGGWKVIYDTFKSP